MAKPTPSPTAVHNDFVDAFPEEGKIDARGARVNPGIDTKRDRLVRECYRRINKQGWEVATVVSVLTFDLDLNLGYGGHVTMPKKPGGASYVSKVIDKPYIDPQDEGDGKIVPVPVFPTEIAEDLVREYAQTGGVFFYVGDVPLEKFVDKNGRTGLELLEDAQNKVLTWYEFLYQEGMDQWSRQPLHRNITDRMRDAAKELFRLGVVDRLPDWTKVTKEESPNTNCDGCGQVVAKLAKFCPSCETILNDPDGWVKDHRPDIWVKNNKSALDFFIDEERKSQASQRKQTKPKDEPQA